MPPNDQMLSALKEAMPGLLDRRTWLPTILAAGEVVPRRHVPSVVRTAHDAICAGERQKAVSLIALSFRCQSERTLDEIRRQGAFRCSKYRFHTGHLRPVVTSLLVHADALSLSDDVTAYLRSISTLLSLGSAVRHIDTALSKFLRRRKDGALKAVVALVDSLFMLDHQGEHWGSPESWEQYTKEELAEAGSYIIHRFDAEIGLNDKHLMFMDEAGLVAGLYHKLLVKACKIRKFLSSEILIDAFDYRCTTQKSTIHIEPPRSDLEISIRLGFIQNEQASQRLRMARIDAIDQGQLSIFDAADNFYDQYADRIVKLVDEPIRRYIFIFPDIPPFRALFSNEELLVDEKLLLGEILDAELVTISELRKFEIGRGLTVFDILKVYRLLSFIGQISKRHLSGLLKTEPALAYRSLVPVFQVGQFEQLLEWCVPHDVIASVIDMLSWGSGAREIVDLQYRPILKSERHYLIPLATAGSMNWYRNIAYTQRKRVIDRAEEEAASRALAATLGLISNNVRKNFGSVLKGKKIEIDVLARFGDYLFVFECKHSLLPCNPHEMRTSYELLKKAASQLSIISELLAENDVEAELYRRIGWHLSPATEIITCIVSCNGMFPGLVVEGHPIRRWAELRNVVESGIVRMGSISFSKNQGEIGVNADGLVERSLWDGSELTPGFLRRYIKKGILRDALFRAMVKVELPYEFDNQTLVFHSFALDAAVAQKNIEELAQSCS